MVEYSPSLLLTPSNIFYFPIIMSTAQTKKRTPVTYTSPISCTSKPLLNKEEQLMDYFNTLKTSKDISRKSSRVTSSSEYHHVFQEYAKKQSQIDCIVSTFDNGHIYDYFAEQQTGIASKAFLACSVKIKESVENINRFYTHLEPLQKSQEVPELLDHERFSHFLASQLTPKTDNEQVHLYDNKLQRIESERIDFDTIELTNKTEAQRERETTKIDLLLTEIEREKKRKDDTAFYEEAMTIRLTELVQFITEEDDHYLGLSLNRTAFELLKNINSFKGQTIEGCLKLPLIQFFFIQFKELQSYRLLKLGNLQKKEGKKEVCSQLRLKSSRNSKREKYSEPNSKRNSKVIQEEDWIGNLE